MSVGGWVGGLVSVGRVGDVGVSRWVSVSVWVCGWVGGLVSVGRVGG